MIAKGESGQACAVKAARPLERPAAVPLGRTFAAESGGEEEQWCFHCDNEQRRVRRKERARAASAWKRRDPLWFPKCCRNTRHDNETGHFPATYEMSGLKGRTPATSISSRISAVA